MRIDLEIRLPRDATSVPIVRRMLRSCLTDLGASEDTCLELELAVDEACANVIQHATAADDYQVRATISDQRCSIDIINAGASAFPLADATPTDPTITAEHGRGLQIINAIVENLKLNGHKHNATELHFEKPIEWAS